MIRLAKVVARSNRFVLLSLIQAEKCAGCPVNCNKPLINIFALRKNLFGLSLDHPDYQLIDDERLLLNVDLLDQVINVEIDSTDLVKSSAWLYLIPLLICLLFISIGHLLGLQWGLSTDLMAMIGLMLGLFVYFLYANKKKSFKHLKIRPKVTILPINGT